MRKITKQIALNLAILILVFAVMPLSAAAAPAALRAAAFGDYPVTTTGDLDPFAEEKTQVFSAPLTGSGTPNVFPFTPTQSGWYEICLTGQAGAELTVTDEMGNPVDGIRHTDESWNGVGWVYRSVSCTLQLQADTRYVLSGTVTGEDGLLTVVAERPNTLETDKVYLLDGDVSTVFSFATENCAVFQCAISSDSNLHLYRENGQPQDVCADTEAFFLPGNTTYYAVCYAGELLLISGESCCSWDDGRITLAPTETTEGILTYTCTVCGATKTETLAPAPHTHEYTETVVAPTCTEEGYTLYQCLCGLSYTGQTVPALGHSYALDKAVEPTCTEAGSKNGVHCTRCGDELIPPETLPALGHDYTVTEAVEPTCTEPGKTAGVICSRCGEVFAVQEEVAALGHDWDAGKVIREATETEDGVILYTCSRCKQTKAEIIPSYTHEHIYTETVVHPTCTEQGYTLHECYCGQDSYKDSYVDALGHTVVIDEAAAATCTEPGKTIGVHCSACNEILIEQHEIAALGHDIVIDEAVEPTCTEPGKTEGSHCARCGEVLAAQIEIPASGHNYENGICTDCGAEDPNYEPPTEPVETEPIETEPVVTEPVETEPIETTEPCEGYTDIDRSAWYHEAADFVLARGIMSSTKTDSKTFEPYTVCTRSMIAQMLYSLENKPAVTFEAKFPDVKENQWFTDAVMWAYQRGVVTGYDNGNFGPNDKVTREQMAVILKAYAEKVKGLDTDKIADLSDFADFAKVTWSKPYIRWAVAEGLLSGKAQSGKLYLDPQGNATRAEVAAIMMSFITKVINK